MTTPKNVFDDYILDIETKGDKNLLPVFMENIKAPKNYKDEKKIAEFLKEKEKEANKLMATDTDYSEIFCIGLKKFGEEGKILNLAEFVDFLSYIGDGAINFITFNGKKFDFPVLIKNGLKKGLTLPYSEFKQLTTRYPKDTYPFTHKDLFDEIGSITGDWKNLDLYSQIYLGKKMDNKGEDFFEKATDEEIKARCLEDLQTTEDLYIKFLPML